MYFACATEEHAVTVYQAESFELLLTLHGHKDTVRSLSFSADCSRLASSSTDIIMWDLLEGTQLVALPSDSIVWSICFGADKNTLFTRSRDRYLRMWDVSSGSQWAKMEIYGRFDSYVPLFYRLSNNAIISSADDLVRVWEVSPDNIPTATSSRSEQSRILSLAVHPQNNYIVYACIFGEIRIWDVEANSIEPLGRENMCHCLSFNLEGTQLASGADNIITIWDFQKREILSQIDNQQHVFGVAFSPVNNMLACSSNVTVRVYELTAKSTRFEVGTRIPTGSPVCYSTPSVILL
jgi:WD40 repeat protein